ncbi:hypothetical protein ACNI3K_02145 [Demequina sp. SO4-13]|uniref:hypothetical protein n=1 Tax=Demequina sp. SO4-13 TaxID=3401027 RepID=UPI003AF5C98B
MTDAPSPMPVSPATPEGDTPRPARANGWWWVIAGLAVATLITVMVVVAQTAWAPRTPWDENGIFQLARVISGEDDVPLMATRGYYPGTSVLVAPVYWFTSDAQTAYGWANLLTNILALTTIAPLAAIARRVGLATPQAIAVSAIALCLPAYAGLADYVLSEQVLTFFIVLAAYGAFRFWAAPSVASGALLVGATLAALFTHPRGIVLVAVVAIWLCGLLFDRSRRRGAGVTVIALLPLAYATKVAADHLASLVLVDEFGQGNSLFNALAEPNLLLLLKTTFLQSWAQTLGTLGLLAFGAVVLVVWGWNEVVRERRFGPGVFLFGLTLGGSALSWVNWAAEESHFTSGQPRFDSWVYTRYIAPFVIVAVVIGMAALLRRMSWPLVAAAIGGTAAVSAVVVFAIADTIPLWGSSYGPGNIAAIRAWEEMWPTEPFATPLVPSFTNEARFWLIASVAMVLIQLSMVLLARFPRILAVALIAGTAFYAIEADEDLAREAPHNLERGLDDIEGASGENVDVISFEMTCDVGRSRDTALNWTGYWFAPTDVDLFYAADGEQPESPVIFACEWWEGADDFGAVPLDSDPSYGYTVFVGPGDLQDTLRDEGLLRTP